MRLVLAALRRPLTVVVALIAIALCAILAVQRMPVDIFPQVGDPAIYVAQPYGGMDPAQMEGYLTYYYEYHFLYITGIDHVESKSIQGAALMKLVFHADTNMSQAMSETVGYVNRARAFMPPGTVPPFITRFDAGSVAVGLLVFSSAAHSQGEMQDFAHQPRAAPVRDLARRFRAAALRWESAHHRGDARSGQAAAVPHLARGSHRRRQPIQRGDAVRQHVDRARSSASRAPTRRWARI
jgi:Cu/Ag efflux pump CusA